MKKILGLLFIMLMLVTPLVTNAVTANDEEINIKKYNTLGFREILAQEGIKEEFKDYSETDDQITIYLFRGNGCGYCQKFLKYMNGITTEYGKYFKIVGFEVWSDQANSELLGLVSDFLGEQAGGVPYIVIGDQVFPGFDESYGDGIKAAITNLYNSDDRYDVFEEYNAAIAKAKSEEFAKTRRPIIFNFIFVAVGVAVVCYYVNRQNKMLLEKLTDKKAVARVLREDTPRPARPVTRKPANRRRR